MTRRYEAEDVATYDSRCGCGEFIEEGDDIFLVEGEWVCEFCID